MKDLFKETKRLARNIKIAYRSEYQNYPVEAYVNGSLLDSHPLPLEYDKISHQPKPYFSNEELEEIQVDVKVRLTNVQNVFFDVLGEFYDLPVVAFNQRQTIGYQPLAFKFPVELRDHGYRLIVDELWKNLPYNDIENLAPDSHQDLHLTKTFDLDFSDEVLENQSASGILDLMTETDLFEDFDLEPIDARIQTVSVDGTSMNAKPTINQRDYQTQLALYDRYRKNRDAKYYHTGVYIGAK